MNLADSGGTALSLLEILGGSPFTGFVKSGLAVRTPI